MGLGVLGERVARAVQGFLAELGAEHPHTKLAQGLLAAIRDGLKLKRKE